MRIRNTPSQRLTALRKKAEKELREQTDRLNELSSQDVKSLVFELGTHQIELEMQNEELRRVQSELEESRNRYADLYDFAPLGYFTLDKNGLILEVNLAGAGLLGVERGRLTGRPLSAFIADTADKSLFYKHCRDVLKNETKEVCELRLKKKDGTIFYAQLESVAWTDRETKKSNCRTAVSDISVRRRAEAKLRKSEKHFQALFANMLDGSSYCKMLFDEQNRPLDFVYLDVNNIFNQMTGLKNVTGKKVTDVIPGIREAHPELFEFYGRVALTGCPEKFEIELKPFGKCFAISAYSIERGYFVAVFDDITKRKRAEEALDRLNAELELRVRERTKELVETEQRIKVSNELLKLYTRVFSRKEYAHTATELIRKWTGCRYAGIRIADQEGNIPYESCLGFNREFLESENLLSLKQDQCACTRVVAGTPEPQDLPAMTRTGSFYSNDTMMFAAGLTDEQKTRFRGVCVRSGFTSVAVVPIRHRDRILGAVHLADKREGKVPLKNVEFIEELAFIIGEALTRFSLKEERARLVAAVEAAADAVVITDARRDGLIRYVNPAFEKMTGYTRYDVVGRELRLFDNGKHEELFGNKPGSLKRKKAWTGRLTQRKKDGGVYEEECTYSPVKDPSGKIINYVSIKRDVTEKLRLDAISEAVNTMDNIGYIFSGIRHEIGNPVNNIKMAVSFMKKKLNSPSKEELEMHIDDVAAEVSKITYLLTSLKNFNMYENMTPKILKTASFVETFARLLKNTLDENGISMELSLDPEAEWIYADPRALQQVLLNVCANAIDAVRGRPAPKLSVDVTGKGQTVRIRVKDNGCGISEDRLHDLFKPFHTTKADGTGLGLVIVKKMLIKMNGSIKITSRRDEGTTAQLLLPAGD